MLSIPEDPLRDTSPSTPSSLHSGPELRPLRSPMQLTVPNLYRMRSPASDGQVEELQIPRLQAQVRFGVTLSLFIAHVHTSPYITR
jgi:hypothetical protein